MDEDRMGPALAIVLAIALVIVVFGVMGAFLAVLALAGFL